MSKPENPPAEWTSDNFAAAMRSLWIAIAEKAEGAAFDAMTVHDTAHWGQLAETAYWQATGEGDCESLRALAIPPSTESPAP